MDEIKMGLEVDRVSIGVKFGVDFQIMSKYLRWSETI